MTENHSQPGDDTAATEADPAAGVLDLTHALASLGNSMDTVRDVGGVFRSECPELIDEIERAIDAGDAKALRRAAHTLKGSASLFGASATEACARALEEKGRDADLDGASDLFGELRRHVDRMLPELERALALDAPEATPGA